MANLGQQFDAGQHEPEAPLELIPAGKYPAWITDSDVTSTKAVEDGRANRGKILKLEWTIIDGDHKGRKLYDNVNLENENPQAEEIGQRQLSTICRVLGKMQITDSSELHNIPAILRVKVRPAETKNGKQYEARNEVAGYYDQHGQAATAAQAGQQPPAQAQPAMPAQAAPQAQPAAQPAPVTATAPAGGARKPWQR